jgi:hypothetical protein
MSETAKLTLIIKSLMVIDLLSSFFRVSMEATDLDSASMPWSKVAQFGTERRKMAKS